MGLTRREALSSIAAVGGEKAVKEALAALGYSAAESLKAVRQITNADELSTEELLKQALKLM